MQGLGSILFVDDEETFRESTCRLLRREGFDCHGAADADEGLSILRANRFDLLVADIRMPANPELRIVRAARELDHTMPVILMTGYPSMETAIHSVELSVAAYLTALSENQLNSAGQIHELFGQLDDFSWKSPGDSNR
ncbi:MAG: response regulator [Pirellulaceae bacterium]